jgi:glycosyltransferase involved in cell wall biosynthesis
MTTKPAQPSSIRVALLTNMLAPYWKLICQCLSGSYQLRVFLSTRREGNRTWPVAWAPLDVVMQRSVTLHRRWKHPSGFNEEVEFHLPLDTLQQLNRFRPGIVLSAEMGFRTLLACVYRKFNPKSRLLVIAEFSEITERGRGRFRNVLRNIICKYVDGFLVPGRSGARHLESIGVQISRIWQTGYTFAVNGVREVPLTRPPDIAYRLLYVGQLIERKGLLPFLDALAQWASHNPQRRLEFVLVGDGPGRSKLAAARVPSNLNLTLHGSVPLDDLPGLYASSGVFAFPTFADTWGVVVNEAMAAGLPVLGSMYSQAVEELVEDGHNGWSFHPDDPCDTYASIDRALNTPLDTLNRMRACARQTAQRYTPAAVAANIDKAIQRVLGAS